MKRSFVLVVTTFALLTMSSVDNADAQQALNSYLEHDSAEEALAICNEHRSAGGHDPAHSTECWLDEGWTSTEFGRYLMWWTIPDENGVEIPDHWWYSIFDKHRMDMTSENRGLACCETMVGNPINILNGNKYQKATDFESSSTDGRFDFTRHYNSTARDTNIGIGKGWTHSFYGKIEMSPDPAGKIYLNLHRADGNVFRLEEHETIPDTWISKYGNGEYTVHLEGNSHFSLKHRLGEFSEMYSPAGLITSRSYPDGYQIYFNYQQVGGIDRLDNVVDIHGRKIQFSFNAAWELQSIVAPDGSVTQFVQSAGLLTSVSFGASGSIEYQYVGEKLAKIFDETSQLSSTFTYEGERAITTERGMEGYGVGRWAANTSTDFQNHIMGPLWGSFSYMEFDTRSGRIRPSNVTNRYSRSTFQHSSYDPRGNRLSTTHFDGRHDTFEYNDRDLVTRTVKNVGTTSEIATETTWHSELPVPTEYRTYSYSGTLIRQDTLAYNARAQLTSVSEQDPASGLVRTTSSAYCEQADVNSNSCPRVGLIKSVDGPRTDVADTATYTYYTANASNCDSTPTSCTYRKGDLWKVANAASQVTEYTKYDGAGRLLSFKDANGVVTDFEYSPRGWMTARKVRGPVSDTEADDAVTKMEYWLNGLLKKKTSPDGDFVLYTYDSAGRLIDMADSSGGHTHYTLDNAGNVTREEAFDLFNELKRTQRRTYDHMSQLLTVESADYNQSLLTYDLNGNVDTVRNPAGMITDNDYDARGRLKRSVADTAGIGAETLFVYDGLDNLISVTDPKGLATSYVYNALRDMTSQTSPDTGVTSYVYDSAGNRQKRTDARGKEVAFTYDELNRVKTASYTNTGLNVIYTYDSDQAACTLPEEKFSEGRLTQISDATGNTQFCFDRFGNVVKKVQTTNGLPFVVRYEYTLSGRLKSMTYPDGMTVAYQRDSRGLVEKVSATLAGSVMENVIVKELDYAPFGPPVSWKYGNNRLLSRPLDLDYRPTAIQDTAIGGLSIGFTYDGLGNISELMPPGGTLPFVKFSYDSLNRLTEFKDGPTDIAIETYEYNPSGDRLSLETSSGTQYYSYPAGNHRLTQAGSVARAYDASGNIISIGGAAREFAYDDMARLSQVKQAGIVKMNYAYNGKGEQVRKYLEAASTYAVYDEAGRWLGDYDSSGSAIQQVVWMDNYPVGLIANGNQIHYIQPDHVGSPRVVIEAARNLPVWSWDLRGEAFGSSLPNQDADSNGVPFVFDMRFPGQRYDSASNLNYNYFRDYDPTTGRYAESDPIGLDGGTSTYSYAAGNPISSFDLLGLLAWTNTDTLRDLVPGYYAPIPSYPPQYNDASGAGVTTTNWKIESECTCIGEKWEFNQFRVNFETNAFVRTTLSPFIRAWALRAEILDHGGDYRNWSFEGKRKASALENQLKGRGFASEEECKSITSSMLHGVLYNSIVPVAISTVRKWDDSGLHSFNSGNRRP